MGRESEWVFAKDCESCARLRTVLRGLVDKSSLISVILDKAIKEKYISPKPAMLELIEEFNTAIAAAAALEEGK